MKAATSTLLDLLRIISAFVVFVSHCAQHWSDRVSGVIQPFAHHAVVVFFVLSGYVIAFATLGRSKSNAVDFAVARLSRLYSVVIPALVLTGVLQITGSIVVPEVYEGVSRGADSLRYVLSLVFMQSAWFLSAAPATNGPLWSLSYEAWYYVAFGVMVFSTGKFWKFFLVGVVCLIAGPNIILLAPAWLVGAGIFLMRERLVIFRSAPVLSMTLSIFIMVVAHGALSGEPFPMGRPPFYFSASFLSDWVFSLGVALFIVSVDSMNIEVSEGVAKSLRTAGDYTFPVYLFHFPVIFFLTAISNYKPDAPPSAIAFSLLILAIVLALSFLSERFRPWWRESVGGLVYFLGRKVRLI